MAPGRDTPPGPRPWTVTASGLDLVLRLTPRGGRATLGPVVVDATGRAMLAARVAAPPVEGAANAALIALVAAACGVPKSAVHLVAGHTARTKRLHIAGDAAALAARLASLTPDPAPE